MLQFLEGIFYPDRQRYRTSKYEQIVAWHNQVMANQISSPYSFGLGKYRNFDGEAMNAIEGRTRFNRPSVKRSKGE